MYQLIEFIETVRNFHKWTRTIATPLSYVARNTWQPSMRCQNQQSTEMEAHDDLVFKRVANGHKVVIGCPPSQLGGHHPVLQRECKNTSGSDAAFMSNNFLCLLNIYQHLWDGGGSETDVCKGQVGKCDGSVEVGV